MAATAVAAIAAAGVAKIAAADSATGASAMAASRAGAADVAPASDLVGRKLFASVATEGDFDIGNQFVTLPWAVVDAELRQGAVMPSLSLCVIRQTRQERLAVPVQACRWTGAQRIEVRAGRNGPAFALARLERGHSVLDPPERSPRDL